MNSKEPEIIVKMISDKAEWDKFFQQAGTAAVSQDWEYGEFRTQQSGWQVKRYVAVKVQGQHPVAMYQVYERSLFGIIKLGYLNRGPVFIEQYGHDVEVLYGLLHYLKKTYSLLKGRILIMNHLINNRELADAAMKKNGFIRFRKRDYLTSYIDLLLPEDILRKNLKSKWRNQLNVAEKKEVKVVLDAEGRYADYIIEQYALMTQKKKFDGMPSTQLRALFSTFSATRQLYCLVAEKDNIPVAFTCLLGYGQQAVYFIGWISDEGRAFNPSNLLLWNAIVWLKKLGYTVLDLGGMKPVEMPGIAKFKMGLGGKEVTYSENWLSV